jgi:hypothetical protein
MKRKSILPRGSFVLLLAALAVFSSFRSDKVKPAGTYLHKISSTSGQTRLEYNADKSLKKILQFRKTENASYTDVILPVYENGRLARTLFADTENATTGDVFTSFDYSADGNHIQKVKYYRNNDVFTYDSLTYDAGGKLETRYHFGKHPSSGKWQNTGYEQFTWDQKGNIERIDNYGKQPGYSKFVCTSSLNYTYDNAQNPQHEQPNLAFVLEANAANMSANNVLSETISSANSSIVITNSYTYAYNAAKYPVRGTFNSGMDNSVMKLEWVALP